MSDMKGAANAINWFEIPVIDFERAAKFYGQVFDFEIQSMEMGGALMGFFPYEQGQIKVSGAIVKGEGYKPCADGAMLYLNGNPDLADALGRVEAAGGKVIQPKMQITENIGYMAIFLDSEGNRIALHSKS